MDIPHRLDAKVCSLYSCPAATLMEGDAKQPSCSDPLLLCCMCKSLLRDPVQLHCVHSCCRQCLSSTTEADKSSHVTCPSCNRVTQAGDAEPNTFLAHLVRDYAAVAETNVCAICKENGDADVLALVWCGSCRQSLCGDCVPAHSRYNRNHRIQSLDELKNLEDSPLKVPSPPSCSLHGRPLEVACITCEKAKCFDCWAACNKSKHETNHVNDESFETGLRNLKSAMSSMQEKLLKKSEVFEKCKLVLNELKTARDDHLGKIQQRKRRIMDTVESVYQEIEHSTNSMYDSVEMEAQNIASLAASLEGNFDFSRDYVHRLVGSNSSCDLWNQQRILRNHLTSLSAELDKLTASIGKSKSVCVESSLPENVEYVLRSWIGKPRICTAQVSSQPQSRLFCAPSGIVQLPVECYGLALTQDGHVLVAARERGLLECCTRGHMLCKWRPYKLKNGREDKVEAVCALRDGRVAVAVFHAQLIVLLRRVITSNPSGSKWIADRRLVALQSPPRVLSADGDMLAVAEWKWDEPSEKWFEGPQLELMRLSSGKQQASLTRGYYIGGLALTVQALITSSYDKVVLDCGRKAHVIDAHDRNSDVRLWRYELLNDDEVMKGVFPDSAGRVLYVALQMIDGSSGRVAAISLEGGTEHRHHVLSFDDRLLPVWLSSDHDRTVIASLCNATKSKDIQTLTLSLITEM